MNSGQGPRLRRAWRPVSARRFGRFCVGGAVLMITVALGVAGGFFYLLATGPINLDSLKPRIATSLEERLGSRYSVSIGSTYLMRAPTGVGIGFGDIEIRDPGGKTVVAAPSGRVGLDVLSLLWLDVKVRRLELEGLDLALDVRPDGTISVAAASTNSAAPIEIQPPASAAPAGVDTSGARLGQLALGLIDAMAGSSQALDRVTLKHGRLQVQNEALAKTSVYTDLDVAFDKGASTAAIAISANGPAGRWSVVANAGGGDSPTLGVEARDLGLEDLLLLDPRRPPFESDMPISFKFDAGLNPQGVIQTLQGGFTLGAGYFKLDDPDHEPFLVDEATGRFGWDPDAKRFRFDALEALAGASHFRANGWVAPPGADAPTWRGHLESHDSVFAAERPGEQPVPVDDATFDAEYSAPDARFKVDRLHVHGPRLEAQLQAETTAVADGATLKLKVDIGPSGVADVMRLWPSFINAEARNWCLQNIKGGDVAAGSIVVDWDAPAFEAATHKRAVPPDSVHGEFAIHDASVDLLPGVPPLTGVDISGVLTGHEFSVSGKHGSVEFSPTRKMQASDIFFKVPDTSPAPIVAAQAGAHIVGSADALADLLSRDAIKRFAGFAVDPSTVKGQFQGALNLDLSLGKSVRPEDQRFRAEGALTNFQLDKYIANEKFDQGALNVVAESGALKITGQGLVNGAPTKVDLSKGPTDDGQVILNIALDDAARAKLGFSAGPPMTGVLGVRVKAPLNKSGADMELDLAHLEISTPEGATLKAAGKPGKATFTVKYTPDGISVGAIAIDAGTLMVRGTAQLTADGTFQSAKVTQARISPGDDFRLDLSGASPVKAVLRGASFDARALVKAFFSHEVASTGAKDIDIDMKVANVVGANKQSIEQFEFLATRRGGQIKTLVARGNLGDGQVTASKNESGLLRVNASDAGALGRFLDIYNKLEGGDLDLMLQDGSEGSHGVASVKNFVLRNEPALRQLAAAGPAPAKGDTASPPVDPNAVKFDRMTADFTRTAGRVDLHEALIYNNQVGLTTQGFIDYAHDRMDLNGTFVPAYQLNTLVTRIPVVGLLLGGGKHEGIFGVNYRISGPASGPTLNVNPLSGMTPGILRKIFGAVDGTTPPQGVAPPSADQ